jgi:hypothetical protein
MSPRRPKKSGPQHIASYVVLAALCSIAAWLWVQQSSYNPAVLVALRPLPLKRQTPQSGPSAGQLHATARLIPELDGFLPRGGVETYGPDILSDKIDGKAELYLPAGFKEMSCRIFSHATTHIEMFVYEMLSDKAAFAVFSGQRRAGARASDVAAHAYATPNALFFASGVHYVEIVADKPDPTLQDTLETLARALLANTSAPAASAATKAPGASPEQEALNSEAALFPKEGLAPDTLRLSAADVFGLQGFSHVFTAEYHVGDAQATAFITIRASDADAAADSQRYLAFLTANGYMPILVESPPPFSHFLRLDALFEVIMTSGRVLAGVHDASSLQAAIALAARLTKALQGKTP